MSKIAISGDRELAIIIVSGEAYISNSNRQEALAQYFREQGIDPNWDWECATAVDKTYEAFESHEMYGFDLFYESDDLRVLAAHDEETLNENRDWAEAFAASKSAKIGFFDGYSNRGVCLIPDKEES